VSEDRTPATRHLRWWKELAYAIAFYSVYSWIRNQFGSAHPRLEQTAIDNAELVRTIERWLGSFHEETIQEWFLDWDGFMRFWNIYYGSFHFIVTTFCIFWLYRRFKDRYVKYRTTLGVTTALALIGYATFPLMPPRLLPEWGFVDGLAVYGGLWSFDSEAIKDLSNQWAAMPSLHFAWASWCALVLVPTVRRQWVKVLAAIYPFATLFAIVVTGNHFWLDAAGGALILGIGWMVGTWWARRLEDRVGAVDDERVAGVVAGGG
jgi:uncharacterized membrane protein YkvA (DUF1232 family)